MMANTFNDLRYFVETGNPPENLLDTRSYHCNGAKLLIECGTFPQKLRGTRNNHFKELKFKVDHEKSLDNLLNRGSSSSKGKRFNRSS